MAANWKMNKTSSEALEFLGEFLPLVDSVDGVDIVIAPPHTLLISVGQRLGGTNVSLSAQDVFYEPGGAYTGQVSTAMLRDAGCAYSIVGHSERRQYFGETDQSVNKKISALQGAGIGAVFCVGETEDERRSERTFEVLRRQLAEGLTGLPIEGVVVAYEPVWAIGTGLTASTGQAEEAHAFIREELAGLYGAGKAGGVRVLYGGSVKPDNVSSLMALPNVDGALVGGASLKAGSFAKIVKFS